jgi:hypothetical protein
MSCEVCVGWMDGSRLMRVEIELASYCSTSAGSTLPLTNGGLRSAVDPVPILANESKALRRVSSRATKHSTAFVSPYTDP